MSGALQRPPRETYVRTYRPTNHGMFSVEPGVEFRDADDFEVMSEDLRHLCFEHDITPARPPAIAEAVAAAIIERWPDRAYFVEVHGPTGWIQIFQPYGVPRNQ